MVSRSKDTPDASQAVRVVHNRDFYSARVQSHAVAAQQALRILLVGGERLGHDLLPFCQRQRRVEAEFSPLSMLIPVLLVAKPD